MWKHVCVGMQYILHLALTGDVLKFLRHVSGPVKEMSFLSLEFRAICQLPLSLFLPILESSLCLAPLSLRGAKPRKGE